MKYIRTKDGRITSFIKEETEMKLPNRDIRFYLVRPDNTIFYVWYDEIVEIADTIKELMDEFILVAPYRFKKPKTATELEKDLEEMIDFYKDKDDKIYGAIWMKLLDGAWRLEPVAKINDKGELELLWQ